MRAGRGDQGGLRRGVTLREVAAAAKVSPATASKALNGLGRMTDDTRARIRDMARQLGFRPNRLAQGLVRKRSFTVGLLTDDSYGRFTLPVMAGISDALVGAGVSVFLSHVEDAARGQLHVEALLDKQVDGLIATGKRVDRALPVRLDGLGVPVVYCFTEAPAGAVSFVADDAGGAAAAVRHLIAAGRRRIAHVTGPASFAVVADRAAAARAALLAAGLPGEAPLRGAWSEAWGHEAVAQLFRGRRAERPDALFCGNDQIARGAVDALRERGLDVPGDVAVVGFDNWEIVAAATRPPLTTVDMNLPALGRDAGLTLLALVEGQDVEPGLRRRPCRLVVRQSCGAEVRAELKAAALA